MKHKQQGFTLLEVLVAFAIAAVALISLMNIFSGGLRLSSVSEDYSRASMLAESLAAQVGIEYGLHNTPTNGTFDDRFNWQIELISYELDQLVLIDKPVTKLLQWNVHIDWQEGTKKRSIKLSSLVLMPNQPL